MTKRQNDSLHTTINEKEEYENQVFARINDVSIKKELKIIMKYSSRYDKRKKRIDYVLAYRNVVILLEFGRTSHFELSNLKRKKDNELETYKQNLYKRNVLNQTKMQLSY